jgi:hypothetical protein
MAPVTASLAGSMRTLGLALMVMAVVGCAPDLPPMPAEGQPVSYTEHLEALVQARCVACHTTEEPEAELVLEPGVGYAELVGPMSTQVEDMALVVPGDPEASYLWLKLDHRAAVGKGMPRVFTGARRLPDPEVDRFRRWIEDGALP